MSIIKFTITLTSDGEPASGFGTNLVDSMLPRDIEKKVILPASHIKGIIRENLEKQAAKFIDKSAIDKSAIDTLFGKEDAMYGALFHMDNAVAKDARVFQITRTKLNEFGTAHDGSLRTSEAVAAGTSFKGIVTTKANISQDYEDLLKLGLLSLFAVGGGRNRGAGACFVTIDGENITPGEILRSVAKVGDWGSPLVAAGNSEIMTDDKEAVTLKVIFKAKNPICVPETPIVGNNVIKSGFTIPASAVQGAILHRLNDVSQPLATACYESKNFRAWPLNPTNDENDLSIRVSFTHKLSKLKNENGEHHFEDETIRAYDWDKILPNSPLKASDGVLLSLTAEHVKLWKSSDMARVITAHGVQNGNRANADNQKRNLYTIEALAPATFTGLISMPKFAADCLKNSLKNDSFVQFGNARSVRGGGQLIVEDVEFGSLPMMGNKENVFIVQSPIWVPQSEVNKPVADIISKLVLDAGFGEVEKSSGSITTMFGWNRTIGNGFLGGASVIAPGAVFKLKKPINNLEAKLIAGIGDGRERGFGAVIPHPGIAQTLYPDEPPKREEKEERNYALAGYDLWKKAKASNLSASQISRVRELCLLDSQKTLHYLERQKNERPAAIWNSWKDVIEKIKNGINDPSHDPSYYSKVLKVCQDLLVADDKGDN